MKRRDVIFLLIVGAVIGGLIIYIAPKNQEKETVKNQNELDKMNITLFPSPTTMPTPTQGPTPVPITQLQMIDIKLGDGAEVKSGDMVLMNYVGAFQDGRVFDSSYARNKPFETQIGVGRVIQGWDLGVPGMKKGGKRRLLIPPDLAYGAKGVPGAIPPNASLVFEVELLDFKSASPAATLK